jgi:hypothetical protein
MRRLFYSIALVLAVASVSSPAEAQTISGDYIETRSADVWTGPCVANGEMNLTGDQAILAWRVSKGSWNGVSLDGMSVVGVVKASATLGDTANTPYPAKAVIIVDDRASLQQRTALVSMAKEMSNGLLDTVVRVQPAPIEIEISHTDGHYAKTMLRAGEVAGIETRAIGNHDHLCGNEEVFYKPLAEMNHAMPAVAELDSFKGEGLGVSWVSHGRRSAFVGSFTR